MALTDGLVSYWKLDETSGIRRDRKGDNDLTPVGTVSSVAGKRNLAAQMLLADAAYLSKTSPVGLGFTGSFTVAWWSYINSLGGSGGVYRGQIGRSETTTVDAQWYGTGFIAKAAYNNAMAWCVGSGFGLYTGYDITHVFSVATGQWNLFIAWVDVPNAIIDITRNNGASNAGALTTGVVIPPSASTPLYVGRVQEAEINDGIIDEVGIWSRVLTADERTALWNGGAGWTYGRPVMVRRA